MMNIPLLGVNIDHIATLRNARGVGYPCPIKGALICEQAGASGITLHLREDRRHIQDKDVYELIGQLTTRMNLEMAVTDEMLNIALKVRPAWVCLVPEKRQELTTEGGLDIANLSNIQAFIHSLQQAAIKVSLFIDPDPHQVDAAIALGADAIELHTGAYAHATLQNNQKLVDKELDRIQKAVAIAQKNSSLLINAGHGLTRDNVAAIAQIDGIHELNIGHALISDAIFMGLDNAVKAMKMAFVQDKTTNH